jgi:hypothetical protein
MSRGSAKHPTLRIARSSPTAKPPTTWMTMTGKTQGLVPEMDMKRDDTIGCTFLFIWGVGEH